MYKYIYILENTGSHLRDTPDFFFGMATASQVIAWVVVNAMFANRRSMVGNVVPNLRNSPKVFSYPSKGQMFEAPKPPIH